MKKFFIALFLIMLIAVVCAGIFLMTLDVDQFRPQIVSQIENAIKKSVRLERIKLGWQSGIALDLKGFAILKGGQSSEALVEVDSAKAVLELKPLLSRQIQIASIYLDHPSVRILKRSDGTIEGMEAAPAQASSGQEPGVEVSNPAAALPLLVSKIRVNEGEVFFKDESSKEPMEVNIRKITVALEDVAFGRPIDFKVQAALLSGKQNLDVKGKFTLSAQDHTCTVSGLHVALELTPMDFQEILKLSPGLKTSGLVPPLKGVLTADLGSLRIDDKGLSHEPVKIRLEQGEVRLQSLRGAIQEMGSEVTVTPALIAIQNFTAKVSGGKIEGQGAVDIKDPRIPRASFIVKAKGLKIEELTPPPIQAGPQVKGVLSAEVKGSLAGAAPEQVRRSLSAEGVLTVDQGVITDMNVLREVFQKLSVIPGLVEKLLTRLPENYQEKLKMKDTKLQPVQLPFLIKDGTVFLTRLNMATDSFQIAGSTTYGLERGAVDGEAVLSIEPDLSGAMIRSVEELQYLTNDKKEIRVPLVFRGNVPQVTVMPDLTFIASTIAAKKANEMIGGFLQKALGGEKTLADGSASPAATTEPASTEPAPAETKPKKGALLRELIRQGVEELGAKEEEAAPKTDTTS